MARARTLNEAQGHRGPDHQVIVQAGTFTLANTRLAIQDPGPAGNQPFRSADGRYLCVFNGEIYNYRELIDQYHLHVTTACDGEVIPALWAKLGIASLLELRGMYAIALVDTLEERLYLARDPFGIKPLHWRPLSDGTLVFASEIRPLASFGPAVRINPVAVARYFQFGAIGAAESPFAEISAVPPNSVVTIGRDRCPLIREIIPGGPLAGRSQPADLASVLPGSIGLHLNADVPTVLLLSGGVDSGTIAAVARRLGVDLDCLTVATGTSDDESRAAARTARHYGHRFHRLAAAPGDGDMAGFFRAMQRPTVDGLNTYLISKAVHEAGFKVALSGLGADEALGGYLHFRLLRYLPKLQFLRRARGPLPGLAATAVSRGAGISQVKAQRLLSRDGPRDGYGLSLLQRELLPAPLAAGLTGIAQERLTQGVTIPPPASAADRFSRMVAAEVQVYLQPTLLPDADSFSMASSVELRVPFVDRYVFSAAQLHFSISGRRPGKSAIGAVLADPYLQFLAAQPKRGFSLPMRSWLAGPLAGLLAAASEPDAPVWSVIDRDLAVREGLVPVRTRERWAETWSLAALNGWLLAGLGQVAADD